MKGTDSYGQSARLLFLELPELAQAYARGS
jgi:hypothetical protein